MDFRDVQNFVRGHSLARDIEDMRRAAQEMVVEEAVAPVRDLGRYAAFGCVGSLFWALGALLISVGLLRVLALAFHGTTSFVPYLVVAGVWLAGLVFVVRHIAQGRNKAARA